MKYKVESLGRNEVMVELYCECGCHYLVNEQTGIASSGHPIMVPASISSKNGLIFVCPRCNRRWLIKPKLKGKDVEVSELQPKKNKEDEKNTSDYIRWRKCSDNDEGSKHP